MVLLFRQIIRIIVHEDRVEGRLKCHSNGQTGYFKVSGQGSYEKKKRAAIPAALSCYNISS